MFYLASRAIGITTGFLFPVYSSYKAIRANDAQTIEHWLMYWVVMAGLHTVENTVEWSIRWFPFYYEAKSILVLWLTLPQIQGSTYVYLTFVEPFLTTHEAEIDDTIAKTKAQARAAGLDYARRAWLAFRELVLRAILSDDSRGPHAHAAAIEQPPPTVHNPASAPAAQAWSFANGLVKQYGPAALAAGQAIIKPLSPERKQVIDAARAAQKRNDDFPPQQRARYPSELGRGGVPRGLRTASASVLQNTQQAQASGSRYASFSRQQLRQRRLELEQELAALESNTSGAFDESSAAGAFLSAPRSGAATPTRGSGPPSPLESVRPGPPTPAGGSGRDRHISAPTPPRSSSMAASYDSIGREELNEADLPSDWGRNVAKAGWKGAPPASAERPMAEKRGSWFSGWRAGSEQLGTPAPQGNGSKGKKSD